MEEIRITSAIFPCKDCKERKVGCHSTCEKYLAIKKVAEEERKQRIITGESNSARRSYIYRSITRRKNGGKDMGLNFGNINTVITNRRNTESKRTDD